MAYDPMLAEIGNRIIKRREELHMSAAELAIQADMQASQLSLYENGQQAMNIARLCKIAEVLKVPLSYLQPDCLDHYSEVPKELYSVLEKLKGLPPDKKHLLVQLFESQISLVQ